MENFLSTFPSSSSKRRRRRRSFSSSSFLRRDQKSPASWAFDVLVSRMRAPSSYTSTEEGQTRKNERSTRKAILTTSDAFCLGVDSRAQSELCEERLARGTTKDISLKTSPKRMDDDVNCQ